MSPSLRIDDVLEQGTHQIARLRTLARCLRPSVEFHYPPLDGTGTGFHPRCATVLPSGMVGGARRAGGLRRRGLRSRGRMRRCATSRHAAFNAGLLYIDQVWIS